jgi:nickel-dependent lactate racemase
MTINFGYPGIKPLKIKEEALRGIYEPAPTFTNEHAVIQEAFNHPIGQPRISEMVKSKKKVLIIVDDYTRSTPIKKLLPFLFQELEKGKIKRENIKLLIALGSHRQMTPAEITQKIGNAEVKIFQHHSKDEHHLEKLGKTSQGTPIYVNKLVKEADYIIGIGEIVPHRVTGFSGGSKIIQPGISGEVTTGETHWLSANFSGREIFGRRENPVRTELDEVARRAKLATIVNVIPSINQGIGGIVVGDFIKAHREGAKICQKLLGVKIPPQEIVIIASHPYNTELWQAAKGIYASELIIKRGGVVILVTTCPEGIAPQHPEVEKFGYRSLKETLQLIEQKQINDKTAAAHIVHVGRVIKEWGKGILVCPNISPQKARTLGFIPANSVNEALEKSYLIKPHHPGVGIIKSGGKILPILE